MIRVTINIQINWCYVSPDVMNTALVLCMLTYLQNNCTESFKNVKVKKEEKKKKRQEMFQIKEN